MGDLIVSVFLLIFPIFHLIRHQQTLFYLASCLDTNFKFVASLETIENPGNSYNLQEARRSMPSHDNEGKFIVLLPNPLQHSTDAKFKHGQTTFTAFDRH